MNNKSAIRVVVAIDFGTSRSGYAYAFVGQKDDPICHYQWPGAPVPYEKTSTHLLYSPEGTVEAWGYPATQRYAELQRDANAHEYVFFQNFKMALHEKKMCTWDDQPITIMNGERVIIKNERTFLILDIVADYLSQLKTYILADLRKNTSGFLWDHEILWCLTIPAIWTDADKQLMRDAAQKAELIGPGSEEAERLLLVLEPEAAAIHCLHKDTSVASSALRPDTTFMVIDAGGGTIDITTHKVAIRGKIREFALKEVVNGTGDDCGSTYVDRMFQKFLEEKLGASVWREFYRKEPMAALDMMSSWERQKCNFDHRQNQAIFIPIGARLYKYLSKADDDFEHLEAMPDDSIELENDMMKEVFRPALDGVVRAVEEQFERIGTKKCDFIFLVGGFASSRLLQERIEQEFGSRVKKVIVPTRPGAAILLGAVSYGLDPSVIRSRRTRLTYGIRINENFDPDLDPKTKKKAKPGGDGFWCTDRFSIFVKSGDGIAVDQANKHTYYPLYPDQEEITFGCYATSQRDVRYTDEDGCSKIGEVTISRDDISNGKDWPVEVTMYFGKTEIKVEAKDKITGNIVETNLRFSPMYTSSFMID